MDGLADGDEAESDGDALDDAEAEDDAVADDGLALGVAVGVGVEPAEGDEVALLLGEDAVDGAEVVGVEVLGVAGGVVAGWAACVVLGSAGTAREASGTALELCGPGSVVKVASGFSDAIELTDVLAVAADCVVPPGMAPVPTDAAVVAATLTCADGLCVVTGADIAEAWAGWLAAVVPRVIAAAAAAMPSTPTELSSTPFVGCIVKNAG